jgi:hypothetical protein
MKKLLAVLAGATLLLSACADNGPSASDDPKAALVDALKGLSESEGLTQTIRLESDTASLVAASEGDLDEETAQKILDSNIVVSALQAEKPEDAASQILVTIAGNEDLEIRFVDGNLYFRADVGSLLETFGQDPAQLDMVIGQVQGQPGLEWVEDAAAGDWVVLEDALQLSEQLGGAQMGAGSLGADQQKELVNNLLQAVEKNATVTSEGDDDAGEHVRASLPLKETLTDLIDALGPAAGMAGGPEMEDSLAEVPNEDITIDFWISDGTITQIAFDVVEFAESIEDSSDEEMPEGVENLSVVVEIEDFDGSVEPVADAAKIDTAALGQAFAGMLGGGVPGMDSGSGSSGGAEAFDCDMLKGAPPEVIALYAEECPELQKN